MDFSLVVSFVFYFVFLGLLTYWLANKTVSAIRIAQSIKDNRLHAQKSLKTTGLRRSAIKAATISERQK